MDLRGQLADWAWLPGSIGLLVVFQVFVAPVLTVPPAWFALGALAIVYVVCFGSFAREDPVAFTSVAALPAVFALVALAMPWPVNFVLDGIAFVFTLIFAFAADRIWPIWWPVVLRRPALPIGWKIDQTLRAQTEEFAKSSSIATSEPRRRDRALRAAARHIAGLRELRAPDADWAALRDELCEIEEAWLDLAERGTPEDSYADLLAWAAEFRTRYEARRARG